MGLFNNPKKWVKSNLGSGFGVVLGNMLFPGVGGVIGGAVGGLAGDKVRGRKGYSGTIRGLTQGLMAPTAASLAGAGASKLGAEGLGSSLSDYGAKNSILSALGFATPTSSTTPVAVDEAGKMVAGTPVHVTEAGKMVAGKPVESLASKTDADKPAESFLDMLIGGTKKFASKPKNLLSLGSTYMTYANRPKEKSIEQKVAEAKKMKALMRMTPQERMDYEADMQAEFDFKNRLKRQEQQQYENDDSVDDSSMERVINDPKEYNRTGRLYSLRKRPQVFG